MVREILGAIVFIVWFMALLLFASKGNDAAFIFTALVGLLLSTFNAITEME